MMTGVATTTYATWNPSDKNSNLGLSNGNLTVSNNVGGAWHSVRATIGKSSGKWYWETKLILGTNVDTGVANTTQSIANTQYPGASVNSWGYLKVGSVYHSGSVLTTYATYAVNDIIGLALDMDAGTCAFYKNNVLQGTVTGISGIFYPMVGLYDLNAQFLANFGATTMAYTAPTGFNQGLHN